MRKRFLYTVCAFFGAIAAVAVAESDWLWAAVMGALVGLTVAVTAHAYPRDIAPPSDRRHEATQRRKGVRV